MQKTFAVFRAIAALALVLALVAGLFSPRGISAQDATPTAEPTVEVPAEPTDAPAESVAPVETTEPVVTTEPETGADAVDGDAGEDSGTQTGDQGDSGDTFEIATEAIELRARVAEGQGNVGDTIFVVSSDVSTDAIGDSTPLSGATFQVVTNQDNTVIDEVTTGDTGLVFLDIPLGVNFRIVDTSTNDQSGTFNFSPEDVQDGRPVVTATRIVAFGGTDVPGEGPTGDEFLFPVAVDQIELRARTQEVAGGDAGTTIFLDSETGFDIQAIDDSQPAEGLTFRVVATNGDIVDEATTGPDGILLLDAPLTVPFQVQDTETLDASNVITLDADDVEDGRVLAAATRFVPVEPGQNEGPTGDILPFAIAEDQVELRARYQQDPNADGSTLYVQGGGLVGEGPGVGDADFANGESIPAAGVTFTVLSEDGLVVDQATTDADGIVLLDVPLSGDPGPGLPPLTGTSSQATSKSAGNTVSGVIPVPDPVFFQTYTIIDSVNNDESDPIDGPDPVDITEGRDLFTATLFTDDLDDVAPSDIAIPSASASASVIGGPSDIGIPSSPASASAEPSVPAIENAVVITGQISENADRAGEYDYFYNFVQTDEANDVRLAGAGEQTYTVAYFDGLDVVEFDSGATDENGMVTLDAPVGFDYFIFENDDFNDPYGSQDVPADTSANFLVIEYVTDIAASPSADASADASADSSAAASAGSSAAASQAAASAAASSAGTGGATALPNTGAGDSGTGSSMTWALFALLAVVGVAVAGFGLRRRTV